LTVRTKKVIDTMLSSAVKDALIPDIEFWSSSKTLITLAEGDYFKNDDNVVYPENLKMFLGSGKYYLKCTLFCFYIYNDNQNITLLRLCHVLSLL